MAARFGGAWRFYPEDFLVACAARKLKHPIKWVEDRREHFMAIGHSRETACDVEMAFDKDGTILGLRGDVFVDIGAYVRPNGMTPVRNLAQYFTGPYVVPNIDLRSHAVVTNKTPSGTFRGPGRFEGCFFFERMIDIAAQELALDRLEIRRHNLIPASKMPYSLAPVRPLDGFNDTACDSGDYLTAFERCVAEGKWRKRAALAGELVDGRYHGVGISCFIEGGASWAARDRADRSREGRHHRSLCRLVRARAGAGDHHGADHGRLPGNPHRAHPRNARIDDLSRRGV